MDGMKRETGEHDAVPVQAIVTAQAAYYYAEGTSFKPCNWVTVYGAPGHTVICNVGAGGEIVGASDPSDTSQLPSILHDGDGVSYGTGPYTPILNRRGVTWFLIRGTRPPSAHAYASNLLSIEGDVADQDDPAHPATLSATFRDYWDANPQNDPDEHFIGYAYTTGAVADGLTPCCIYVKADSQDLGFVRVTVSGELPGTKCSASIVGAPPAHPDWCDVKLQSDGSATILLVDTVAELVSFTLGLPNAPGTDQLGPFAMRFSATANDSA